MKQQLVVDAMYDTSYQQRGIQLRIWIVNS